MSGDQSGAASNPEPFTSIKGKKAANRRGRRRWQASKNAKNGTANSTENDAAHRDGTHVQQSTEPVGRHDGERRAKEDADIRLPQTGPGLEKDLKRRVPSGRRFKNGHHNSPLYAALDLGTNNCRLLIARPEDRGFRVVDAYSRIVRLGEGVGSNKNLSSAAMDRAIDALANCHKKLADRGVLRSRLIATEACRAAENGSEFIDRVRAETGLALEIVDRETEARLAVAGCASLVDHEADGVILFDIGGGSSEIVWLDLRNRCGARGYALTRFIRSWISLPVGVVNLAERHGGVHVTPDIFEAMVEDAAEHLSSFGLSDTLSEAITSGRVHMLGTSGTVTTLAGVHLGLRRYDRRKVDGTWLDDHDVAKMIDQLRDMPYEARVDNPCIGADRADLVLAGCAILEAIRRRWTCSRLRVADRGLREGILTELMAADGVWANKRQGRRQDRRRQRNRA
ncbi:Ppx/GppA phosphatase family protein [uncultured Roseibium sp.]|uniref:Ppx/GppA phosphatase family protein n=1 Tax=uncultured Roseibium sp. TaxID=1936171 RepID=UPI00262439F6|nr:Ppx/GppA phosphatase family protein [uncultured Roseibium sp.]